MKRLSLLTSLFSLFSLALLPVSLVQAQSNMMPTGVVADAAGSGPYPALAESFASMRENTVYRPASMPQAELPVILWGNGACRDNGLGYSDFHREVSSHGFIVISAGYPHMENTNALPPTQETVGDDGEVVQRALDPTNPEQLINAISWVEEQNNNPNSPLYQHVDLDNIAVMGHSCGGLQAIVIAADPRIDTAIIFNSGVVNAGPDSGRSGISVYKDALERIHTPVAYINGGPTDIAYLNGLDDFERINHVPIVFAENQIGHGGTFRVAVNGGDYGKLASAWMLWQLKGDQHAAQMFVGEDCGVCNMADWKIMKKAD
jgi:dienelactone hydrolase